MILNVDYFHGYQKILYSFIVTPTPQNYVSVKFYLCAEQKKLNKSQNTTQNPHLAEKTNLKLQGKDKERNNSHFFYTNIGCSISYNFSSCNTSMSGFCCYIFLSEKRSSWIHDLCNHQHVLLNEKVKRITHWFQNRIFLAYITPAST